ncbi:MAG: P-II family nitrogen regulator [Candidatus Methanomethylophilaceae archaeon]|nr:P-II family nitrogen regulator [Candidatus Methanomethylophilaceae archaeon]
MKMIMAIVRPEKSQEVKDALHEAGYNGMTLIHVTGRGMQAGLRLNNRFGEFLVDEIEKVQFEVVVEDTEVEHAVDVICRAATTGTAGDGRVFIVPIESTCRISSYNEEHSSESEDGSS